MIQYNIKTVEDCVVLSDTDIPLESLLKHINNFRKCVEAKNCSNNPVEISYRVSRPDGEYSYMYLIGVYQEYADKQILRLIDDIHRIDNQMTTINNTIRKNVERGESIKTRQENMEALKLSKEKMLDLMLNIGDDTSRKYIRDNIDTITSDILDHERAIEKMMKVIMDEVASLDKLEVAKVRRADLEKKLQERMDYLTRENN